jgi:hypothetical protein
MVSTHSRGKLTLRTDGDELDALVPQEQEASTGVCEHLDTGLGVLVVARQLLVRENLKQVDELDPVGQVGGEIINPHIAVLEKVVRPAGESLAIHYTAASRATCKE